MEVVAYVLDRALGFGRVAPVVLRNVTFKVMRHVVEQSGNHLLQRLSWEKRTLELAERTCGVNGAFTGAMIGWWNDVQAAKTMVNAGRFVNNHIKLKLWWHKPTSTDTVINEWGVNGRRLEEDEEDDAASDSSSVSGAGGDSDPKRIVRFEVHPMSYQHHYDTKRELFDPQTVTTCGKSSEIYAEIGNGQNQLLNFKEKSQKIIFSYSVE